MAKNGKIRGFFSKFLTKFAFFDEQKMAFLVAKTSGAYG